MLSAEAILKAAEDFKKRCDAGGFIVSWADYEHYRQMLLDNGCYGYEGKLADILNL